jgi:hypothetical protein
MTSTDKVALKDRLLVSIETDRHWSTVRQRKGFLLYSIMAVQPFVGHWSLFQFLNLYTVGRTPWMGDQPVARPPTHRTTQIQNKRTQISMPRVGFEPTTSVFERAKTVYALYRVATVISRIQEKYICELWNLCEFMALHKTNSIKLPMVLRRHGRFV